MVPAHWDVAKICLVARLESGHTPSRQHPEYWIPEECAIPWFSLADVWQLREANRKFLGDTAENISPLGTVNSAARVLPAGTVVLSRTASVGFAGIMPRPMATTQDFANWVCGSRLLPEYLLWAFRAMKDEFGSKMMGSTHQTIYMPDIRRLTIPVPSLVEQRIIADFLDRRTAATDALVAKKQRLLDLLEELLQRSLWRNGEWRIAPPPVPWLGAIPQTLVSHAERCLRPGTAISYRDVGPGTRRWRCSVRATTNISRASFPLDQLKDFAEIRAACPERD